MKKTAILLGIFALTAAFLAYGHVQAVSTETMTSDYYEASDYAAVSDADTSVEEVKEVEEVELPKKDEPAGPSIEPVINPVIEEPIVDVEPVVEEIAQPIEETVKSEVRKSRIVSSGSSNNSSETPPVTIPTTIIPTAEEPAPAVDHRYDMNRDGRNGTRDLNLIMAYWGDCSKQPEGLFEYCMGDVDINGTVNFADITALLANWSPRMRADVNYDDVIGHQDVKEVVSNWLSCPSEEDEECRADVNEDGEVNFADITAVLAAWDETSDETEL